MRRLTLDYLPPEAACDAAMWRYDRMTPPDRHTHTFPEITWIDSGTGVHWINGEARPIQAGDVLLIRRDDAHTFTARDPEQPLLLGNVPLRPTVWRQVRDRCFRGQRVFFDRPEVAAREFRLDVATLSRVRALAADLLAGANDAFSASAFVMALLALLAHRERRAREHAGCPSWLRHARDAIQIYPAFVGGVRQFVQICGRSPEHVARECRRHFDRAPRDLVNEARLHHAAMRLRTSDEPIVDLALEAGFENLGHFYGLFRARYGAPPRRYRLRQGRA